MSQTELNSDHSQDEYFEQQQQTDQPDNTQPQNEIIQGHIRGFYNDLENKAVFATNFDTTSAHEQQRRRDRLARFGGEHALEKIAQLDTQQKEQVLANKRLERFTATNQPTEDNENIDTASDYPQILPFEELHRIPEEQIQFEMRGFQPHVPRRFDTVHLFGTRLLKENARTEDLMRRYRSYGLERVEWQSDYRCNLVFADEHSARRILDLESYALDLNVSRAKKYFPLVDSHKTDAENALSWDESLLPFLIWRQSLLSEEHDEARGSLSYRLATTNDIKEPIEERKHSRFYLDNMQYFTRVTRRRRAALEYNNRIKDEELALEIRIAMQDGKPEQEISALQQRLDDHRANSSKLCTETIVSMNSSEILPMTEYHDGPKVTTTSMKDQVEQATVPAVAPPQGARGRGFTRGRQGVLATTSLEIQRPRGDPHFSSTMNDKDKPRERNRVYQAMPQVVDETPLAVTLKAIQENQARRREQDIINAQKEALMEIKRQNNLMTRVPINYTEQRQHITLPTERGPRQASDLVTPQAISFEPTGMSAMFLQDLSEKEQQIKREQEEIAQLANTDSAMTIDDDDVIKNEALDGDDSIKLENDFDGQHNIIDDNDNGIKEEVFNAYHNEIIQ